MNINLCYAVTRVMTRMGIPDTPERAKWVDEVAQRSMIHNGNLIVFGHGGNHHHSLKAG